MQQKDRCRSRAGRGLSLLELTTRQGFCWNRLWDTQERATRLLCSLKRLGMGKLDSGLHNGPGSQESSYSSSSFHAKRLPALETYQQHAEESIALSATSVQKSRETRAPLGLAVS